jgi:hypothetical protein
MSSLYVDEGSLQCYTSLTCGWYDITVLNQHLFSYYIGLLTENWNDSNHKYIN